MKAYLVTTAETGEHHPGTGARVFFGDRNAAHDEAKAAPSRPDVRVEFIEIQTDKLGILMLANGGVAHKVLTTWKLSSRGALTPCENGT